MSRFLPQSIVARVIVVLLVGLTGSHLVSMLVYYGDRLSAHELLGRGHVAERVATLARLINRLPEQERRDVIAAANRPDLQIRRSATPGSVNTGRSGFQESVLRDLIAENLRRKPDDSIVVRYRKAPDGMRSKHIEAAIRLDDGSWLRFRLSGPPDGSGFPMRIVLSTGLMVLAVLVAGIWVAQRVNAPLVAVARAAERLGADATIARLPERGPSEVRQMARAFNQMQERIQAFVDDRTNMLAAISHDLRTPITRLRLRAEFIEDEEQRTKTLADLDHMEKMIASVLSFAKDEHTREERSKLDLGALLQSICADMSDIGRPAQFEGAASLEFIGRPVAMKRAFTNLVDNAIKYGSNARVSLSKESEHVVVRIDDDGTGIPEEDMEKVFEPFFRIDRARNIETGGAGLGLPLTRSIIRAHGGDIRLSNRDTNGLRVEVVLPA